MEESIRELVALLKDVAPEVWEIALRQTDVLIFHTTIRLWVSGILATLMAIVFGGGADLLIYSYFRG